MPRLAPFRRDPGQGSPRQSGTPVCKRIADCPAGPAPVLRAALTGTSGVGEPTKADRGGMAACLARGV